jgi:hypothetical protein
MDATDDCSRDELLLCCIIAFLSKTTHYPSYSVQQRFVSCFAFVLGTDFALLEAINTIKHLIINP